VTRGRGRKGWLPAFRDATLFKVAYGYGLFSGARALCGSLIPCVCAAQKMMRGRYRVRQV
jgi:hypothetical protein